MRPHVEVRQVDAPTISLVNDKIPTEARERVHEALRILDRACPRAAREVRRRLRRIRIAGIRSQPIVVARREMVLGDQYVLKSAPAGLALVLVFGAVRTRLEPFSRPRATADRHAQISRRVLREVVDVAKVLDRLERPDSGVGPGRLEQWASRWLSNAAVKLGPRRRQAMKLARDMRRLGVPKWLVRAMVRFRFR